MNTSSLFLINLKIFFNFSHMINQLNSESDTLSKYINEQKMDSMINIYGFTKINKIDNKLRFEHVRVRPIIERYFKFLIDNIH